MEALIYLGLFIPLTGFLTLLLFHKVLTRNLTSIIGCSSIFISFCCFAVLLYLYTDQGIESIKLTLFHWLSLKQMNADFALRLDHLSMLMTLIITGIGFLIHVYSVGYTDHEEDFVRYFAFLNFFVFAMLLLVLSANLLLMFMGWEGVGLASYLLIGYWYKKESAATAGTKAFVVNRIGDLGFLLGLLLTFYLFQTSDIETIIKDATIRFRVGDPTMILLTLCLFIGAIGKSAQIPLHIWLPDAMAGPTPVSALIHAATMVTAGVYLIVRLHTLYLMAPLTLQIVGLVGGVTALYAALSAIAQTDLKKVLAYSTVSQLGFMFLACGAGAFYSAMFHLTMHAFVKGLLFLSAGNVVHMMQGKTEMSEMGGLHKRFPVTHWLFLIGVLSLAGVPPFAAFFSKDLILEQEYLAGYHTLFYMGLVAAVFTGFYLTRAYFLTFRGELQKQNEDVKEAPLTMLIPCSILAFLAMTGGLLGATFGKMPLLVKFLIEVGISPAEKEKMSQGLLSSPDAIMTIAGAFIGIIVPALFYGRFKEWIPKNLKLLRKAFFVDDFYDKAIAIPLKEVSRIVANDVEPTLFEGSIMIAAKSTNKFAEVLQSTQNGQIRTYGALITIGAALLMIYILYT